MWASPFGALTISNGTVSRIFSTSGDVEFAADQALDRIERIRRIGHGLTLGDLADETFVLIGKTDNGRRRAAAFFVRNDLHRAALENGDAAVCRAEIDAYYFTHNI